MSSLTVTGSISNPQGQTTLNININSTQNLTANESGSPTAFTRGWYISTSSSNPSSSSFTSSGQPSSGGGTLKSTSGGNINSSNATVVFHASSTEDTYYVWVKGTWFYGCFLPGSLVELEDGTEKAIETLEIGGSKNHVTPQSWRDTRARAGAPPVGLAATQGAAAAAAAPAGA